MTLNWGYLDGTAMFLTLLVGLVAGRSSPRNSIPSSTGPRSSPRRRLGTTMADFADRSLGIGYTGGSSILLLLIATLALWYWSLGSISVETVKTPRVEAFYWAAITFSQTLGTALGDWTADTIGLGYGAARCVRAALAIVAALYYRTRVSHVLLFWAAFILTRPLGATLGDLLDKPLSHGGLHFSRPLASAVSRSSSSAASSCCRSAPARIRGKRRPRRAEAAAARSDGAADATRLACARRKSV